MDVGYKLDLNKNFIFNDGAGVFSFKDTGAMFLRQRDRGQKQFEYLIGDLNIDESSLDAFDYNYKMNVDYTKRLNIPYCHVVFPCKALAYKKEFKDRGVEVKSIANERHINKEYVYYPLISEVNPSWYIPDDTHCSCLGNMKIIDKSFERIGYSLPKIRVDFLQKKRLGDLGRMVNSSPITINEASFPNCKYPIHTFTNKSALPGNNGNMIIKINPFAATAKRLVLFGDSFFVGCLTYLSQMFREIFYIRSPYILKDVANSLEPDVILTGNAERYLVDVPNSYNEPPYFIKFFQKNVDLKNLDESHRIAFINLFSGRYTEQYNNWYIGLKKSSYIAAGEIDKLKKFTLGESDLITIKRKAELVEGTDLPLAFKLMSLALAIKPDGTGIKKKLEQYTKELQKIGTKL